MLTHLCPKSSILYLPSNYLPSPLSSMPIKHTPNVLFESLLKFSMSMADNHTELFLLWLLNLARIKALHQELTVHWCSINILPEQRQGLWAQGTEKYFIFNVIDWGDCLTPSQLWEKSGVKSSFPRGAEKKNLFSRITGVRLFSHRPRYQGFCDNQFTEFEDHSL